MRIYPIGKMPDELLPLCGGKARGLNFLKKNGFNVSDGYIICRLDEGFDEAAVLEHFSALDCERVSVRSSADNEDGGAYSGAGQYETYLNVTKSELIDAVKKCIASLENGRAQSYAKNLSGEAGTQMNVVVQKMVDATHAGVMFTLSPDDKNSVLIEAVEGLGENLVSGRSRSCRYTVPRDRFEAGDGNLDGDVLKRLYEEGLAAAKAFGREADLEWAEENGELYWLQLRPITHTEQADIDEFNTVNNIENHLVTSRNIGEMMPGAITPLSISTSVLAIDYGMRNMLYKIGAIKSVDARPDYFAAFAYRHHLFIDMTALHSMSKRVFAASPPAMNLSIMGEYTEDYPEVEGKNAFFLTKLKNAVKFGKYLFSSEKAKKNLIKICEELKFEADGNSAEAVYAEISEKLPAMNEALCNHYVCSSFSGAMNSALYMTLYKKFEDKSEYQAFITAVLSDIEGIESADILSSLKKIGAKIKENVPDAAKLSEDELLSYVEDEGNAEVNALYKEFLSRHGHRSIKEAELRSKSWKNDKKSLMKNLHTVMMSDCSAEESRTFDLKQVLKDYPKAKGGGTKWISTNARKAVVYRELSKSLIIRVIDKFKDRYLLLAKLLVERALLSDGDCIYFLTHAEIGKLIEGDKELKKKAVARRAKFKEAEYISFEDVNVGEPKAVEYETGGADCFNGVSVCRGKVYGRARVVHNVSDADEIKEGEIMVAAFTDIGWSPYYSLVGALVTEVGSALSHGAVVAREYCLPTLVNVKNATKLIKTGDYLFVDADNSTVSVISEEDYKRRTNK